MLFWFHLKLKPRNPLKQEYYMPKMKSKKGAKKTFRKTATGKFKRVSAYKSHILTSKSTKRKRKLRRDTLVSKADSKRVRIMLQ